MRSHWSSFRGRVTDQIRVSEGHLSLSPLHLLNCRHFESIIFRCSRNYSGRLNVILRSVFEASVVAVRVKRGEEGWLGPAPVGAEGRPSGKGIWSRGPGRGRGRSPAGRGETLESKSGEPTVGGSHLPPPQFLHLHPQHSCTLSLAAPPVQLYTSSRQCSLTGTTGN